MRPALLALALTAACLPDRWALSPLPDASPDVAPDALPDVAPDAPCGTVCNGRCVDPQTDRLHCGGCDRPCSGTCAAGVCACPPGTARCGDVCAYLSYADAHCGVCGNACPRGERCLGGACTGAGLRVTQLSVMGGVTWALMSDGSLRAAGFGVGAFEGVAGAHRNVFVSVPGMTGLAEVSGACGRRADGSVWCKVDGRAPQRVQNLDDAVEIAARCARRAGGTVACWQPATAALPATAVAVPGLDRVVQLAAGDVADVPCALRDDGTVWCWGDVGSLLDPSNPPVSRVTATPEAMPGLSDATRISVGHHMLCAVIRGGTVRCLGRRVAVVGLRVNNNTNTPAVTIAGATNVRAVVAGWEGAWALRDDGSVLAWGVNQWGALADGTFTDRPGMAAPVPGLADVRSLATGGSSQHMCALLADGSARCWGNDRYGQVGIAGGYGLAPSPVVSATGAATPLQGVFEDEGSGVVHCVRQVDGVRCWGDSTYGLLGSGVSAMGYFPSPGLVPGLENAAGLRSFASSSTGATMCARMRDGTVRCWGDNRRGQVGDGTFTERNRPQPVRGVTGAVSIGGGDQHTCAVVAGARLWCWGRGEHGEVGDGLMEHTPIPVPLDGITDVAEVGGGVFTTVARLTDGSLRAWGMMDLLRTGGGNQATPAPLDGVSDARQLSVAGGSLDFLQVCALRASGRVSCRGTGGASPDAWFDVGLSEVTQVSGGGRVTCARLADATVHCWGVNERGGLGNLSLPHGAGYVAAPRPVLRLDGSLFVGAVSVRVGGGGYACARMGDDTLQCWGAVIAGLTGTGEAEAVPRVRRPLGL
ncbi:MAG: hypothetical protein U0324_39695 [Polyangiales bacterium]